MFQAEDLGRVAKVGTSPRGREGSKVDKCPPHEKKLPDHHRDDEEVMLLKFFEEIGHCGLLELAGVHS